MRRPWPACVLAGLGVLTAVGSHAEAPTPALIAPLAVRSLLLDVAAVPGGGLVAVGERGHILRSPDGVSWQQAQGPARSGLTAVRFVDAKHGWAVGHDEVILATSDGGASWRLAHFAPERQQPLLAVCFADASHGLALGAFATIYATDDGGTSWTVREFAPRPLKAAAPKGVLKRGATPSAAAMREDEGITQPHLNAIVRGGDGSLYVAAEAGHLYRSADGGTSWDELPSAYEGSFFGLVPLEGPHLLVFGLRGHLYRSDDSGQSWRVLQSHTKALLAGGTRLADGSVVIVGLAGTVLVSRDGGETFALHQEADRKGFAAVAPAGDGVVIVGEAGVRLLSRDALGAGS